jgi:hypothetical protein
LKFGANGFGAGLGGLGGDAFTVLGFVVLPEGFGVLEDLADIRLGLLGGGCRMAVSTGLDAMVVPFFKFTAYTKLAFFTDGLAEEF